MSNLVPLAQISGTRSSARTEADVQPNPGAFLTLAPLGLAEGQVSRVEVPTRDGTRRRIDVEYGRLVIEVKKNLTVANAVSKAEPQLAGYLKVKRDETGDDFAGIINDRVLTAVRPTAATAARSSEDAGARVNPRSASTAFAASPTRFLRGPASRLRTVQRASVITASEIDERHVSSGMTLESSRENPPSTTATSTPIARAATRLPAPPSSRMHRHRRNSATTSAGAIS